jgi:hypothetical protein
LTTTVTGAGVAVAVGVGVGEAPPSHRPPPEAGELSQGVKFTGPNIKAAIDALEFVLHQLHVASNVVDWSP